MAQEPMAPIQPGCGIKDRDKLKDDPDALDRSLAERAARYRRAEVQCDGVNRDAAPSIRIYPGTKLWATAAFDETLPFVRSDKTTVDRANWPTGVISRRLYAAVLPELPVVKSSQPADDGHNILISQRLGLVNNGRGYCVQLTARQRGRVWSRTIVRDQAPDEDRMKVDIMSFSTDPDHYWTPETDITALADTLATDIGIPGRVLVPNAGGTGRRNPPRKGIVTNLR